MSLGACLTAALLTAPSMAAAAPPSVGGGGSGPEQQACAERSVGDACTLPNRTLGTCASGTCNRLDYSGGSPPKAIEEPCVVCQAGPGAHSEDPMVGSGGPPPGEGGSTPTADTDNSSEPPTSASRCTAVSLDRRAGRSGLGGLGMLLAVVIGLRARRRRRSL